VDILGCAPYGQLDNVKAVITCYFDATDDCGNVAQTTQTVITIYDDTAPVLDSAPADIEISCTDAIPDAATLNATDNCGAVMIDFDQVVTGYCPGTITRTWTATDACGNSSVETQVITISTMNTCDMDNICTDMNVIEIGFGTANARVNATWNNPNGTTDCEVRGGRIAASSIGTGTLLFSSIGNTQTITQTDGSTILFNIAIFNNPNVPFKIGHTYGFEVRCLCEDETAYTNWSGLIPEGTFIVPTPPSGAQAGTSEEAKLITQSSISIFPNPSNGEEANLTISGDQMEDAFIRVMDMNGKVVYETRLDRDPKAGLMNLRFDSRLQGGVYLIQVYNEMQIINQRFVVE